MVIIFTIRKHANTLGSMQTRKQYQENALNLWCVIVYVKKFLIMMMTKTTYYRQTDSVLRRNKIWVSYDRIHSEVYSVKMAELNCSTIIGHVAPDP